MKIYKDLESAKKPQDIIKMYEKSNNPIIKNIIGYQRNIFVSNSTKAELLCQRTLAIIQFATKQIQLPTINTNLEAYYSNLTNNPTPILQKVVNFITNHSTKLNHDSYKPIIQAVLDIQKASLPSDGQRVDFSNVKFTTPNLETMGLDLAQLKDNKTPKNQN